MFEFIQSPNYTPGAIARSVWGVPRTIDVLVGHWWGDPNARPTIEGVVRHFQNRASQVSAHLIISDTRTIQMVNWGDAAWHARQANPLSIGIELDPNGGEAMYRRAGEAVRYLRGLFGDRLSIKPHNLYVATQCPGWIDLAKIDRYSREDDKPEWQKNLVKVTPQKLAVLLPQAGIYDLRNRSIIKNLGYGTQIDFVAKTTVGGQEFYISSYSFQHGLPNGLRKQDVGIIPAPAPTPPPPPVATIPEYQDAAIDTPDIKMYAKVDTELVNFSTGKAEKTYSRGQEFDISAKTQFAGKEYYITVYSFGKKIWKGIPASDLSPDKPVDPPKPTPDQQVDLIEKRMSALEALVRTIVDFLNSIFSNFGK